MSDHRSPPGSDLAAMRKVYDRGNLERERLDPDPGAALRAWLEDARAADEREPNAMVLATADAAGAPSARAVLLKGLGPDGLRFFTNRESEKGKHLAANPQAGVCFLWHVLHRQVRVTGSVERLPARDAEAYFERRPRGSQIAAWASPQSRVVEDRAVLEGQFRDTEARFEDTPITLPPFWGGYLLRPDRFEFWQGRPNRLHDRIRYVRAAGDVAWTIERLAP